MTAPSSRPCRHGSGHEAPNLTPDPTPWHHDATFWPIEGERIASVWTSVDSVDAETSALEFIAGSLPIVAIRLAPLSAYTTTSRHAPDRSVQAGQSGTDGPEVGSLGRVV